jgi:NADPH:quinone reductase-like Zn-dependent oxidoreductase
MALPTTQKKWIINGTEKGFDEYTLEEGPITKVDDHRVLVKLHAAGLNYRDILIAHVSFNLLSCLCDAPQVSIHASKILTETRLGRVSLGHQSSHSWWL